VAAFALIPDLDMAGSWGAALAALDSLGTIALRRGVLPIGTETRPGRGPGSGLSGHVIGPSSLIVWLDLRALPHWSGWTSGPCSSSSSSVICAFWPKSRDGFVN
jgi:hypothetical protein